MRQDFSMYDKIKEKQILIDELPQERKNVLLKLILIEAVNVYKSIWEKESKKINIGFPSAFALIFDEIISFINQGDYSKDSFKKLYDDYNSARIAFLLAFLSNPYDMLGSDVDSVFLGLRELVYNSECKTEVIIEELRNAYHKFEMKKLQDWDRYKNIPIRNDNELSEYRTKLAEKLHQFLSNLIIN